MRVNSYTLADDGSNHYRVKLPARVLKSQGMDIEYLETGGETRDADVLVFNRPASRKAVEVVAKLTRDGYAVVVDVDDLFSHVRTGHAMHGQSAEAAHGYVKWACQFATLVTATTQAIADEYGGEKGRVVPNYVPEYYLSVKAPARSSERPRVGWSGTVSSHPNDLQATNGAIRRLVQGKVCDFAYIGPHAEVSRVREALNLHRMPPATGWLRFDQYPLAMAQLDVGIVPLENCLFNDAKSWLKGLEFAALGVPFVASPAAEYRALYSRGAGKLADNPGQWRRYVSELLASQMYREDAIGGGRTAAQALTIEGNASRWADVFTEANTLRAKRDVLA